MVSKSAVQKDPIMALVVKDDAPMFQWRGHDKRIIVYPVDYDKQYNVTCTHPQGLSDQVTSNEDSATAVGKIIISSPDNPYAHQAELPNSIQPKSKLSNRPKHLQ